MNNSILKTISFAKEKLERVEAGHNWFHTERVWKLSKIIAQTEHCNMEVVELSALLHDVTDPKIFNGDEISALEMILDFLTEIKVNQENIEQILFIIKNISFRNRGKLAPENKTIELKIEQDADRLEAIGAIGIARTFNFGGHKNNLIYHPDIKPNMEKVSKYNGTTINHFYEKLLLLKDMMNTSKGKELAEERHQFMLLFLEQFYKEWNI